MPDWLDLVLVVVLAVFAVFGYRRGFAAGVMNLTGFACGAAVGARTGSALCRAPVPAGPTRDFLAIVIGFAAAVTGMLLADGAADLLRRLSRRPAGLADSVGGAALTLSPATIGSSINARITATHAAPESTLQVYPVRGRVQPGNSGGPVLAPSGRVYGIIFARSQHHNPAGP